MYHATTDEEFTIEKIVGEFDHIDVRWFLVKWEGYDESEWEREHLLTWDKCHDSMRSSSGLKPTKQRILPGRARQEQIHNMLPDVRPTARPKDTQETISDQDTMTASDTRKRGLQ